MKKLQSLLENNREWSRRITAEQPDFFTQLAGQQSPEYLWIGCSDSRVPANQIVGLLPGEVFVHRNVANVVVHSDLNCLSVMQYAVDVLKVKHIIICGHYGCGGVHAALTGQRLGLIDNWLRHVQDVRHKYERELSQIPEANQWNALCALNVIEQVMNAGHTTIVQEAWARGQELSIHGWAYSLRDGRIRDLNISLSAPEEREEAYRTALERFTQLLT